MARSTVAPHPERPANVAPADTPAAEPIQEGEGRNDPASLAATRIALCRAAPWLFALALVVLLVAWFRG